MDISAIPKSFWHALSFAIVIVTCGLVYIAARSANVEIDFANKTVALTNARLQVATAVGQATELSAALKDENERLKLEAIELHRLRAELQTKVSELEAMLKPSPGTPGGPATPAQRETERLRKELSELALPPPKVAAPAIQPDRFIDLQSRLSTIQQQVQTIQ